MADRPNEKSFFATRQSLLIRLKDLGDQEGWQQFFETYWRLIFTIGIKAGLSETDAEDIVQETMVSVAKQIPAFRYDRSKGSFRSWLLTIVRRRLVDRERRKARWERIVCPNEEKDTSADEEADESGVQFRTDLEVLWASEWEGHLLRRALEGVRAQVTEKQYLIYEMLVLNEVPMSQVVENLQTSSIAIHRAKYRVHRLLKAELKRLRQEEDAGG